MNKKYIVLFLCLVAAMYAQAQTCPFYSTAPVSGMGCTGDTYHFSTDCENVFVTEAYWTVNNQRVSETETLIHTFNIAGTYTINGYVYDNNGLVASYTQTVTINEKPLWPIISADKTTVCASNNSVTLSVVDRPGTTYTWNSHPSGYNGTGATVTFNGITQKTTFFVTAANGVCSQSYSEDIYMLRTVGTLTLDPSMPYHKRIMRGSSYTDYLQTSPIGTDTSVPPSLSYTITEPGTFYLRGYNASIDCWATASAPLQVQQFNYEPPAPMVQQVYSPGYTTILLTNPDKEFILTFADYFLVNGPNSTSIISQFSNGHNLSGGTYHIRGRDKSTLTWGPTLTIDVQTISDDGINWIHTKTFDGKKYETVVAESKSYFDPSGKTLQTQTRNITPGYIFTSETLYDNYDRAVGGTLPAPIKPKEFAYNGAFVLNKEGKIYDHTNFTNGNKGINAKPIGGEIQGTLGWYYSENNTIETNVPKTDFPYSLSEYYENGSDEIKYSGATGDVLRLGGGHEILSGTFPVLNELDDYLTKRRASGLVDELGEYVTTLKDKGVQSVVRDPNGYYNIAISDKSGRKVMSARAGDLGDYDLVVSNVISFSSNNPQLPKIVYFYILSEEDVQVSSNGVYYVTDIVNNIKYPMALNLPKADGNKWKTGFYKIEFVSGTSFSLRYKNYYKDISYQFYDDAGRLKYSISPNGYKQWKSSVPFDKIDKTSYVYNFQGRLLSVTEPDAGTAEYIYRRDGKIRFSQNAQQADSNYFSYTHYDYLGRPIESGEYKGTAQAFSRLALKNKLEYDQQVYWSEVQDWIKTYYDVPVQSIPNVPPNEYKQQFVRGAVSWNENENITTWYSYDELGRVTWMAQQPKALFSRTFVIKYEYDFLGNVLKVAKLSYQSGDLLAAESFYHHYEYDKDKRLSKVYTSIDGTSKKLRATYIYYLHGPLKRIELGDQLQGIDFVYNINGWLTHINHPNTNDDPGEDGKTGGQHAAFPKDAFGMTLNYYESDFNLFELSSLHHEPAPWENTNEPVLASAIEQWIKPAMLTTSDVMQQASEASSLLSKSKKSSIEELFNTYSAPKTPTPTSVSASFMEVQHPTISTISAALNTPALTSTALHYQPEDIYASASKTKTFAAVLENDRRFLIDFGNPAYPTTQSGWNNMTNGFTGSSLLNIIDATGATSTITLTLVKGAHNGYGNEPFNSEGYDGTVLDYPVSACRDSHYAFGSGGTYKLSGLNPARYYNVKIFGSRVSTTIPNRIGTYTIDGKLYTLSAANNNSAFVTFHNLKPSSTGEIILDFGVASGSTFGYINVMDINERNQPIVNAPSNLNVQYASRQATLTWTDNATNETGYKIEKRSVGQALYQTIATLNANITQYIDEAVTGGANYEYRVYAYNTTEDSPYSNITTLQVPGQADKRYLIDLGASYWPTNLTGWNNMTSGETGAILQGLKDQYGNASNIAFEIVKNASNGFGDGSYFNTNGPVTMVEDYPVSAARDSYFAFGTGGIYKLKNLDANKLYTIKIFGSRLINANDRTGAYIINGTRMTLNGTNNTSELITFFHVPPTGSGDIEIKFGIDQGSTLGYINVLDITEVTTPHLAGPTSLQAQYNNNHITLTWTDLADNETGFKIERKTADDEIFQVIATIGAGQTQYIDENVYTGTMYGYRVYAYNNQMHSAVSNAVTLTTPGNPPDRRFLIDFGSPAHPTALSNWNNMTSPLTNATINLVDANSNSSGVSLTVVKVASNGFGNGDVFNADGYNGTVGDYPLSACRDSYFSYTTGGTYRLKNLNTSRYYTIKIFGSRVATTTDRKGTYTINGKQYTLDAANNSSNTITFHNIIPTQQGEITLDFGVGAGATLGYLNVMDIQETFLPGIEKPTNLTLQIAERFANLNWTDNSDNELGFKIERRAGAETIFQEVGQTAAGVTTYRDGLLTNGIEYEYRVTAYNAQKHSAYSNTVKQLTPGVPPRRFLIDMGSPSFLTNIAGWNNMPGAQTGSMLNNMIDKTGATSSIGLEIVKNASNGFGDGTPFNDIGYNGTVLDYPASACRDSYFAYAAGGTYKLKGLNPNNVYNITIFGSRQATDANRVGQYILNGEKKTLNAANNNATLITFSQVRATNTGEITLEFGVAPGSQLGYINVMDITEMTEPDLTPPTITSTQPQTNSVTINWTDNSQYETGYEVQRAMGTITSTYTTLTTTAANATSYTDNTISAGQTYFYRVRAVSNLGMSPFSASIISDNTSAPTLTAITSQNVSARGQKEVLLQVTPANNIPTNRTNIVILGSSTAEGMGATSIATSWAGLFTNWVGQFAAPFNVINLAKGGYTSPQIMTTGDPERNITKALTYNPLMIIINLPSNDIASGISPATVLSNLSTIKQQAEAAGVKVYITTTQPRNFADVNQRTQQQTLANSIKSTFGSEAIDLFTDLADANLNIKTQYNYDGVHVNNAGHSLIFNHVKAVTEHFLNKTQFDFTVSNAPSFITVTQTGHGAGKITMTPPAGTQGNYNNVKVTVTDKNGNYTSQTFNLSVEEVDEAPSSTYKVKPLYNGLITAATWRTDTPGATPTPLSFGEGQGGAAYTGMYLYTYDDKYQIQDATWATPDFSLSTYKVDGNKFRLTGMSYDPNGNIRTLKRYDEHSQRIHNFTYSYANSLSEEPGWTEAETNKLTKIEGYVNAYTYNKIGQLIGEDKVEGDDQSVEYDVSGKVRKVFSDLTRSKLKVEFQYDDRGFRLAKMNYNDSGIVIKTTWYIRDASGNVVSIYEQKRTNAPRLIEVPVYGSGKLGTYYPDQEGSMVYELTDHLGNVRALVREHVNVYIATLEDNGQVSETNPRVEEMKYFENLNETAKRDSHFNHTANGEYSSYLYWIDGQQGIEASDKSIGPAIGLKINQGDKIELETWVRYEKKPNFTRDATLLLLSEVLGSNFAGTGVFEGVTAVQATQSFNAALAIAGHGEDNNENTPPFAYLNYIIFNNERQFVDAGWQRVTTDAAFDPGEEALLNKHIKISFDPIKATQAGYIYVWVSNESEDTRVWFDDLRVTHTGAIVTQATDYGVWGDVLREQKADESTYRFGYQGSFAEKDEETGWNHFELREYDQVIGRWTTVDPKRIGWSPYIGMYNNPVSGTDPDGGGLDDWYYNEKEGLVYKEGVTGRIRGYKWVASDNATRNDVELAMQKINPSYRYFDDVWTFYTTLPLSEISDWTNTGSDAADIALGVTQIAMLEYRQALSLSSKIGTFSTFRRNYGIVNSMKGFSSALGIITTVTSGYFDYQAMILPDGDPNKISQVRFAWRTAGNLSSFGAGFLAGAYIGGPYGAIIGGAVGGSFWAAEKSYDGVVWYKDELSKGAVSIQNNPSWFFRVR